jgi:hypothetical protein
VKYKLVTSCRECQGQVYGEDQNTKPTDGDNMCELPSSPMHFRSFVPVIILQNFITYPMPLLPQALILESQTQWEHGPHNIKVFKEYTLLCYFQELSTSKNFIGLSMVFKGFHRNHSRGRPLERSGGLFI